MKVAVLTLGCRVNHYESEALLEKIIPLGFTVGSFDERCDAYIVNSCAVTEESVRKSRQMVRRAVKMNPDAFVGVCGCAPQLEAEKFAAIPGVNFVGGNRNKLEVVTALDAWLSHSLHGCMIAVKAPDGPIEPMRISRFDRTRAYVKIEDGCAGRCSYCVIPKLRGDMVIRTEEDILTEVNCLAAGSCHEVVLTGIETAGYGKDLPGLMKKIAAIEGIHRIRLGSLEPSFLSENFAESAAAIPEVCHHFHISVQSGCDEVLRAMRRKYSAAMLESKMNILRKAMPDVMFSADVIVGFPGETDAMFEETYNFFRRNRFLHLHIFTYSKRPGTEAAGMACQVDEQKKKERLKRLSHLAEMRKNEILSEVIAEKKPIRVLCETVTDGLVNGHTERFFECLFPVSRQDRTADGRKGEIVSIMPIKIVNGKIFGEPI